MVKLTSVQEAAFNAAAEALNDLNVKLTLTRAAGGRFFAFTDDPTNEPGEFRSLFSDHFDTLPEAVQHCLDRHEEAKTAPPRLRTAAAAVEAFKAAVIEEGGDPALLARIDALPVA